MAKVTTQELVEALNQFHRLSKEDFDRICAQFEIDPEDSELISDLLSHGWVYSLDEPYSYIRDIPFAVRIRHPLRGVASG